jgi:hypothetical protein
MVLAGAALFTAGLALVLVPFDATSPTSGRNVDCGSPLTAVGQVDAGAALEGLGRLARTGARPSTPPTAEDLARIEALQGEVERFDACQAAAGWRMHVAGVLELVGAGLPLVAFLRAGRTSAAVVRAAA